VAHEPYKGAQLTPDGKQLALEVLRHHRLLELYLARDLGVPWDRVHDEAEVLEHVLSEELEDLIAAKLGDPTHDPHGDPIPTRDLVIDETPSVALCELEPGAHGTFVRISDTDPEMLRWLAERGIAPGACVEVVDKQPFGGPLFASFESGDVQVIGGRLAEAMRVEVPA
jgi:DtxR family transcriptional regulator, Mn-dependent transcriptional regulator